MNTTMDVRTGNEQGTRAPRGKDGRFAPGGPSPNPGGRPKGLASLVRGLTNDGMKLARFMVAVLDGVPQKIDMLIPGDDGEMKRVTVEKTPEVRDRIEAVKWLSDRGWGKPVQEVDMKQPQPFVILHRKWGPGRDPLAIPAEGVVEAERSTVVSVVPVQAPLEGRQ